MAELEMKILVVAMKMKCHLGSLPWDRKVEALSHPGDQSLHPLHSPRKVNCETEETENKDGSWNQSYPNNKFLSFMMKLIEKQLSLQYLHISCWNIKGHYISKV